MKKKILLAFIMAVLVGSLIVLMETVVFSKECDCFSGTNSEVRIICQQSCQQRTDGGCGWYWDVGTLCSTTSDLCRTKWYWMCASSMKYGYVYFYKSCPRSCP